MSTVFTKIINGEIPAHKILENERFLAFLDIRPIAPGHTLVIPKQEVDYIFDLKPQLLAELIQFAQKVALIIDEAVECKRVGLMVAGLEVPHAHLHLVPINEITDLNFANAGEASPQELAVIAKKIKEADR